MHVLSLGVKHVLCGGAIYACALPGGSNMYCVGGYICMCSPWGVEHVLCGGLGAKRALHTTPTKLVKICICMSCKKCFSRLFLWFLVLPYSYLIVANTSDTRLKRSTQCNTIRCTMSEWQRCCVYT